MSITLLATTGSLIGDPTRANIMMSLMDGRALTAGELAGGAGVTPQTASAHLAALVDGGLLAVTRQGRHRYHRLASEAVAGMLESILAVGGAARQPPIRTGPRDAALRHARVCYDHLAGSVAVRLADSLAADGHIVMDHDGAVLTPSGSELLARLGALTASQLAPNEKEPQRFCRPCLDWSERRPHIAGSVGAALLGHFTANDWVRRSKGRAMTVTPKGSAGLQRHFGVDARVEGLA